MNYAAEKAAQETLAIWSGLMETSLHDSKGTCIPVHPRAAERPQRLHFTLSEIKRRKERNEVNG